jgi:hypothetical protein
MLLLSSLSSSGSAELQRQHVVGGQGRPDKTERRAECCVASF